MAVEIEAKMRIAEADAEKLARRLLEAAGEPLADVIETNVFLDTAGGDLRAGDCGLRVRSEIHTADRSPRRVVVTYKGPRQPGPVKKRREIEFQVDDPQRPIELFAELGFLPALRFEKHRRSWDFEGCRIELDRLPYLGLFVEIEGPTESAVMAARRTLGLDGADLISDSYASMLGDYFDEHELSERCAYFDPAATS